MSNIGTYIMYHCHTEDSLLDSCTKYGEYVDLAVKNGSKALSFSEHGKNLNWTEKWGACKEAGIRYIHSVEIYLTESLEDKVRDNYHTVLMARNMDGVRELNSLISKSCDKDHFYYKNRISFDEFIGRSKNIIATSACLASPLNKLPETHPRYMELVQSYDFLEVQPHNHPEQIEFNKRLATLSEKTGIPLIAGTDTHSSNEYKAECRRVLIDSKQTSSQYSDEDEFDMTYKTYDELVEMFKIQGALGESDYMAAIENTNKLYDMTEDLELDTEIKYPILYGTREKDSEKFSETVERMFKEKCDSGIIPEEQRQAFREAIDEEMRVFRKLKMDGFMLSMSELIHWCKEQGMAIGTARGSVGGSRVAYVADIIDLNPETWHTVFSRFCNEDRVEIGDIDIDCIESDRPAIFKHIVERFGAEKTARVSSFGTIKEKGTIDLIGRHLAKKWNREHNNNNKKQSDDNPWSLKRISEIKKEFGSNPEKTRKKYYELFYYYNGLDGTKISQSVHPAGMVISPITLSDNFGTFDKDGETCLMLDMENVHDYTGLAKYDFLILKTVQVIRDTCRYVESHYPMTHEVDWNDEKVWEDMAKDPTGIFQFESDFAFESLKKFKPKNIFDLSIVTACIRPSGKSYRDKLLAREIHKNPSEMIDELLKDNLGYLIYQEDTLKFLSQICGLSGSEADNIRRAIGRKQKDRLDRAMPSILEGYCGKSPQPREIAEREAKEFLQILEDSASYQFGFNHSIAYCLLSYLCAYYRYYYPLEFLTAFLNNAANDEDIANGTEYAAKIGIEVVMPKWGHAKSGYFFDKEKNSISKGLTSVKYMSDGVAEELYELSHNNNYKYFVSLLGDIDKLCSVDTRQIETLIKLEFFSEFGNQRELFRLMDIFYDLFKKGEVSKIAKAKVEGSPLEPVIQKYSVGVTKTGGIAKSYTMLDIKSALEETEDAVKAVHMSDLDDLVKVRNFEDIMGYAGYVSGKAEDRPKLFVKQIVPRNRKSDGKQFGYGILGKSIGSGKETWYTIMNRDYDNDNPIKKGEIIYCKRYTVDKGKFYNILSYDKIY